MPPEPRIKRKADMSATMTAPRKTKRNARKAEPVPGPRTGSDGGDAWLETQETREAMAEARDAAAHPERYTWHKSLHELFADLYS